MGQECPVVKQFWRNSVFSGIPRNFAEFRNLIPAGFKNTVEFRRNPAVRNSAGHYVGRLYTIMQENFRRKKTFIPLRV